MLKFLKSGSNFKVMVWSKILVPIEKSCHKEYIYEIKKPYHIPFKRYGKCFCRQTDRPTKGPGATLLT
jgi:hypothetical protein